LPQHNIDIFHNVLLLAGLPEHITLRITLTDSFIILFSFDRQA